MPNGNLFYSEKVKTFITFKTIKSFNTTKIKMNKRKVKKMKYKSKLSALFILIFGFFSFGVFAGCSDDSNPVNLMPKDSYLRVIHSSANAPNVDVYANGTKVLSNVPYQTGSSYLKVTEGTYNIKVTPANDTTGVIVATLNLAGDSKYTVIAPGSVANLQNNVIVALDTNSSTPASGNFKLRAIHGFETAAVDIHVSQTNNFTPDASTKVVSSFPFRGITPYLELPAGTYYINITLPGEFSKLIPTDFMLTGANGNIFTAVASGYNVITPVSGPVLNGYQDN